MVGRSPIRVANCLWTLLLLTPGILPAAELDEITVSVTLRESRFFSIHEFQRQVQLGDTTVKSAMPADNDIVELTSLDKAALALAQQAGWLKFTVTAERLEIRLPNPENDVARREMRRQLGELFNIPLEAWPVDKGLHLPDGFDPAAKCVLLIHGLDSDATALCRMSQAARSAGVQVLLFDFPNEGPLAWTGDRLSADLKKLAERHPQLRMPIVAHSAGGLVARYALEMPGKNPGCVSALIMLGTPHHGTMLAEYQEIAALVWSITAGRLSARQQLLVGMGEGRVDLRIGSRFLTELNARPRAEGVRYFVGMGTKSFVPDPDRAGIRDEVEAILLRRKVSAATRIRVLDLLEAEEFQDDKGDGAVTVRSAHLEDVQAEVKFGLNHLELLSLPGKRPEESEVFRWLTRILGW